MKRFIAALALLFAASAFGQSYPSPTYNNLTVQGTFTATGKVGLPNLAAQAANTVVANATASSASPTAIAMPSCSGPNSALQWTAGSGFSCGTTYALTSGTLAQFATTTSAQLAGIISDETGSGSLVFGTAPTINNLNATGTPTAPTATTGTNTTQIATTAFVNSSITAAGTSGRLLNIQVFTSGGTYTPTTGATKAIVRAVGGGGGGGGAAATGAGQTATAGSGSAGGYGEIWISSGLSSQTVTVGAAGSGGAAGNNVGGDGGQTSFGALLVCGGGKGGGGGAASTPPNGGFPQTSGGVVSGTGTFLVKRNGNYAVSGIAVGAAFAVSGNGADSPLGAGASQAIGAGANAPSNGYGAGGSGAAITQSLSATAGGTGSAGIVIVYEYQ